MEKLLEVAEKQKISRDEFLDTANIRCNIAFKEDINTRIKRFGGLDFYDEVKLRFFLIATYESGSIINYYDFQ
jgi:hypothetical protein